MYDYSSNKWCHHNSNRFKEKFESHTRKTFNIFTTKKQQYVEHHTHNTESTAVWNLQPEQWGSPFVREKKCLWEKACCKRQRNNNNNNKHLKSNTHARPMAWRSQNTSFPEATSESLIAVYGRTAFNAGAPFNFLELGVYSSTALCIRRTYNNKREWILQSTCHSCDICTIKRFSRHYHLMVQASPGLVTPSICFAPNFCFICLNLNQLTAEWRFNTKASHWALSSSIPMVITCFKVIKIN